jgi:hypothetical protein
MKTLTSAAVRAQFRLWSHIFYQQDGWGTQMCVPGATVRQLKTALRGLVYQEQRRFCHQVEALGFVMNWCDGSRSWVVHDRVTTGNEGRVTTQTQTPVALVRAAAGYRPRGHVRRIRI